MQTKDKSCESNHTGCSYSSGNKDSVCGVKREEGQVMRSFTISWWKRINLQRNAKRSSQRDRGKPIIYQKPKEKSILSGKKSTKSNTSDGSRLNNGH